jgi:hypothetical protein
MRNGELNMVEDILFSVAWTCGDHDCKAGWHKASYWTYGDRYTVDSYSDGDHEDIDASDLPTSEEVSESWREYARDVLRTGEDPLGEYLVTRSTKIREAWKCRFNPSIVGPVLIDIKRGKHNYRQKELPPHVVSYLNLTPRFKLNDFATWDEFTQALPGVRPMTWTTIHIDHDRPRSPAAVARDLKRFAQRALA